MSVHRLSLRTDYGSQAELFWDESKDPDAVALSVKERWQWTAPELRDLAKTLRTVADALESDNAEWRREFMADAGFVEQRSVGRSSASAA
jgi:hypothetical protein